VVEVYPHTKLDGNRKNFLWTYGRTDTPEFQSKPRQFYDDSECAHLISAFSDFFTNKLQTIRDTIGAALKSCTLQQFRDRDYDGQPLAILQPVTAGDVMKILASMPAKSSPLDIMPTSLLKQCADVFSPVIARLANLSFTQGLFPQRYKLAQVLPLLKKPGLDRAVLANYRPISNLSTISKVLERLALQQFRPHLLSSSNFDTHQSAYRAGHSTETALLEVFNRVFSATTDKKLTVLVGLDISSAFDMIDHNILLSRLHGEFGVTGTALAWLQSYISNRSQFVKLGRHSSAPVSCTSGVPQGSVLGPILFATYTSPIGDLIRSFGIQHHQFADDTQVHLALRSCDIQNGLTLLADCTAAIKQWYLVNGLLLNANKSEAICLGTSSQLRAATDTVTVAGTTLPVSEEIRSLGVIIDRRLTFESHISGVVKSCNYHLRALQHIRHLLPFSTAQTLACSLIMSRLDYCNAVLYGCKAGAIGRLQRVQNYAARVVTQSNRYTPSQPLLQSLHWLPVQQRLVYKTALITYKVITTSTPSYLSDLLAVHIPAGPTRRSSTRPLLTVPYVASNFARRSFCFVSPTVWNSLPSDVQSSPSQATFKSRLKTHLFNIAFAFNDQPEL